MKIKNQNGITLIEILASIVILSIIIMSITPMFIQSSRANHLSKNITESTYLAESEMEEIINLNTNSNTPSLNNLSNKIQNKGYQSDPSCTNCYGISKEGRYILVQINDISTDLGKIVMKIYRDTSKRELESQMEMIISWKK
ncbi:prepilin-type N-terminal cleavage/methylation domain-containing protein [Fredinandcohnia salidurans]|uniref:Prepilin-type N-terminal cleavage/methylation domain-containing protein n=1 Tax=Fredinandcohnia salidurans TaxID=2595041 RepID=A0ABW4MXF4_9BACI|nr:type II secretion system protein [Fredinandcohnia onubensis]